MITVPSTSLAGKNILLICPIFFGYEKSIEKELGLLGANVYYLSDRPYKNPLLRALTNKFPATASFLSERFYYRKHLKLIPEVLFDYIFVINGQTCSVRFISSLRKSHANSRFLLYFWDSVSNRPESLKLASCFDRVFTFDPTDSRNYGWILRPLFFTSDYSSPKAANEFKYGLSFIATAHTDRFSISRKVFQQVEQEFRIFIYLYLQARWVYFAYKILNKNMFYADISDFQFEPLGKEKIREVFDDSVCILDIEHPKQSGLTIRTFEALGAGKKLITTNQSIKSYDFFVDQNICIIDRSNPRIPIDFIKKPYTKLPESIYKKYSIDGWIDEIFSFSKAVNI